ncbi:hypothetical protein FA95DRAFT_1188720 [Auriscalpium vulgare]|uniref:Uncharacterized protein n=1 Tax=Auriscalpium vulgare TaxID=40419 RepID=A0ACB8R4B4_9AGAM|nr:hypothetical protein FA95DRAFT_1188720 [Auriscalpium vulgare]
MDADANASTSRQSWWPRASPHRRMPAQVLGLPGRGPPSQPVASAIHGRAPRQRTPTRRVGRAPTRHPPWTKRATLRDNRASSLRVNDVRDIMQPRAMSSSDAGRCQRSTSRPTHPPARGTPRSACGLPGRCTDSWMHLDDTHGRRARPRQDVVGRVCIFRHHLGASPTGLVVSQELKLTGAHNVTLTGHRDGLRPAAWTARAEARRSRSGTSSRWTWTQWRIISRPSQGADAVGATLPWTRRCDDAQYLRVAKCLAGRPAHESSGRVAGRAATRRRSRLDTTGRGKRAPDAHCRSIGLRTPSS